MVVIRWGEAARGGQQKGLSGLAKHPKGRITTSNPGLVLGCSSSGGCPAELPRAWAHDAHARERDGPVSASGRGELSETYHGRIRGAPFGSQSEMGWPV